jgi:hypothetical protein
MRRADADQKKIQPKASYSTSERDAKRARRPDADYATSERDAKRARRTDADRKSSNPVLLVDAFLLWRRRHRPMNQKTIGGVLLSVAEHRWPLATAM